jgi:hypothetical protein
MYDWRLSMNFTDLLHGKHIDPQKVLVLRHRPLEPELRKVLPWLAAEKPEVFNAYQQAQTRQVEQEMARAGYVAAFIGHEPGKALFVGLYTVVTPTAYWKIAANVSLRRLVSRSSRPTPIWC